MANYDDTATVSGSIVRVNDGADSVGLKNWLVTLPASLDGYTEVNAVKTGKNLFDTSTFADLTYYTVNADGSVTVNSSDSRSWSTISADIFLKAGTYTLSRTQTGSQCYIRSSLDNYASNACSLGNSATKNSFTLTGDAYIKIKVGYNGSYPFTDTYQLEVGSTESTFEKYTAPTTYTASLGRTIYSGQADIVNGQGTDSYGYIVFDGSSDENWGGYSAYNGYYINISDMKSGTRQDGVCNQLTCSKSTAQGQTDAFWLGVGNSRLYVIGVYDSMGNTLEAFKAYLAENPLILVYPLATSTDFTFTPITPTPETALGVSNWWSEQGDSEVTYYKSGYGFTSVTVHKETPEGEPVEETRKLHRIIYEGQVDVINGTGLIYRGESGTQYDPPEQISFTPIEVSTDEGENTLYADEGDSAIIYRKAVD